MMSNFKQKLKQFTNSQKFRKGVVKVSSVTAGAITLILITGVMTAIGAGIGTTIGGFGAIGGLGVGVAVGTTLGAYMASHAAHLVEHLMQSYLDAATNQSVVDAQAIDMASTYRRILNETRQDGYESRFFAVISQADDLDEILQTAIAVQASLDSYQQEHGTFNNAAETDASFQAEEAKDEKIQLSL
jgi:hypothetical protein